ncbi:MAG: ABC transporter permease subunit [Deltaproteobacteria bacterium]|nr:ABC transporter permease subunit [Deltaproteobacteria bacterium]
MRAIFTLAKREVHSFFISPIAYVVLLVWLLYSGISFYLLARFFSSQPVGGSATISPLSAFFGGTTLFYLPLCIFIPIITMRLIAEERSSGTLETLLSAPLTEISVALGKYLAAICFWCVLWVPTLVYVWLSAGTGEDAVDWGVIATSYLGLFCIGLFYMAVGLLMSAVSRNQIVAATLTFLVLAGLFLLNMLVFMDSGEGAAAIFEYIGMWSQMDAFSKGILDTRFVVYDISLAALCVFLSIRVLQANRW